ncbi:MAG TPA: NTP transferase domain-containing protein [Dehalococcoidia bacterium]|nr:NTP transferase domain-containing protein [Dehalococcoidia bacterium]
MRGVFLCGGVGKRMSPLSENKFLYKFFGKTLLQHQIEQAREAGLTEIVLIGNPDSISEIKSVAETVSGTNFNFAIQQEPLGMADALLSASALLANSPFVLVNSNDIFDISAYTKLLNEYQNDGYYSSFIVARQVRDYFPGGYILVNENNEISHIIEKPQRGKEPSNLVNIVVHLHKDPQKLLDYLAQTSSTKDDIYEEALNRMIDDGLRMKAVIYTSSWQAIKYPWHVLDAMDYFLGRAKRQVSPSARISSKAIIDGNVVIGQNAKVLEGAIVRGPSYVGHNSVIGNGVLVRNSVIGDDCVVGYGTEIKHSYIGDRCWFHENYFGDSVVGSDCSFGAGTMTANLRLDDAHVSVKFGDERIGTGLNKLGAFIGDGVRTGINAGFMPGVRVGQRCFVGPHVCLTHDLPEGKKALAENNYRVINSE